MCARCENGRQRDGIKGNVRLAAQTLTYQLLRPIKGSGLHVHLLVETALFVRWVCGAVGWLVICFRARWYFDPLDCRYCIEGSGDCRLNVTHWIFSSLWWIVCGSPSKSNAKHADSACPMLCGRNFDWLRGHMDCFRYRRGSFDPKFEIGCSKQRLPPPWFAGSKRQI